MKKHLCSTLAILVMGFLALGSTDTRSTISSGTTQSTPKTAQSKPKTSDVSVAERSRSAEQSTSNGSIAERILYDVVDEWSIPNGGHGRVLVIDPRYRNESDLAKLGRQLHSDTRQDRNAIVFIFDDRIAASNRKSATEDRLGESDRTHFEAHMIGSYIRNGNTGYHAITLNLEGLDGPSTDIPMPQ